MRLIDADAFDRALCNAKFLAALNHAYDADSSFEDQEMYYSTQSFRDVMKYRPTIDAIPIDQLSKLLAYLFHGCPGRAYPSYQRACHPLCSIDLMEKHCSLYSTSTPADQWRAFLSEWMTHGMKIPCEMKMILEDPTGVMKK